MARRGLNCVLGYSDEKVTRTFSVRTDQVNHGKVMVYEESHARTVRAFFPHRVAEDKFSINVILIGQAERQAFVKWLNGYAAFVLNTDLAVGQFPPMTVNIPSRKFFRTGIPLTGIERGDHVGSMVWNHAVIFEPTPSQVSLSSASRPVDVNKGIDPANSFFYPFQQQLSAEQAPVVYTDVLNALANVVPSDTSNGPGTENSGGGGS